MTRLEDSHVRPNSILVLIDSLRYDVAADFESTRAIAPNLARIAQRGFARRIIANAQSTQFVMPSLFSATYPLDHGGYNNGIRERPASFVECLASAGYQTHLVGACNQIGITLGFDRGFDRVHSAVDYRHILSYRIEKTLQYEIDLIGSGEKSEAAALAVLVPELDAILEAIPHDINISDSKSWPQRLKKINAKVAQLCGEERELLRNSPKKVLEKLRTLPPALYWRCLGKTEFSAIEKFLWRAIESVNWRFRKIAVKIGFPVFPLGHFQVLAGDISPKICGMVTKFHQPWFMYVHFMDVHDSASLSRPWHLLGRLKYLRRWRKARRTGHTSRTFLYDSALMYVDEQIGKLIKTLERNGQLENTIIFATGDHGFGAAGSPRANKKELGHRTHSEDIDVPLFASHEGARNNDECLVDTMGVTATLLETLDVPPHPSFKGKSAFGTGRHAVISENAGRGNADLARRDLYFTVTTHDHKLMATLKGTEISCQELYDLRNDPLELQNQIDDPVNGNIIGALLDHLYTERAELIALRKVAPHTWPRAMQSLSG